MARSPLPRTNSRLFAAVLPVHLAAVVVQFSVAAAGQPRDAPAAGVAVRGGRAVPPVHGHDALTAKKSPRSL